MKPQVIYLIRHGESEGNVNEGIYKHIPDWKINLTEKGIQQAKEAGNILRNEIEKLWSDYCWSYPLKVKIYCSPLYRTRQTAAELNFMQLLTAKQDIYEDPRIREQEWGNYAEDHFISKIAKERKKFGSFYYRMPNGESGADVFDRVTTFIDTMHRDFEKPDFPMTSIVVSHGLTIKAFLMRWFHWQAEDFDLYKTPKNCEILKMVINKNNKYDLVTPLRRRAHVEEED